VHLRKVRGSSQQNERKNINAIQKRNLFCYRRNQQLHLRTHHGRASTRYLRLTQVLQVSSCHGLCGQVGTLTDLQIGLLWGGKSRLQEAVVRDLKKYHLLRRRMDSRCYSNHSGKVVHRSYLHRQVCTLPGPQVILMSVLNTCLPRLQTMHSMHQYHQQ